MSEIPQSPRATIPGSERTLPPEYERLIAAPDPHARATVSILVRPKKALPAIASEPLHVAPLLESLLAPTSIAKNC